MCIGQFLLICYSLFLISCCYTSSQAINTARKQHFNSYCHVEERKSVFCPRSWGLYHSVEASVSESEVDSLVWMWFPEQACTWLIGKVKVVDLESGCEEVRVDKLGSWVGHLDWHSLIHRYGTSHTYFLRARAWDPLDRENTIMISIASWHFLAFMVSLVYHIYIVKHKDNDIGE